MIKKQTISFNEKDMENVEIIRQELGIQALSEVIRSALSTSARKLRPTYTRPGPGIKADQEEETPEDRLKRQIENKKEKAQMELLVKQKAQMELAEQLYEPAFEETPSGDVKVTWPVFEKIGQKVISGSIGKMLNDIYPLHIEGQFKGGSREEIIKLLKKQK